MPEVRQRAFVIADSCARVVVDFGDSCVKDDEIEIIEEIDDSRCDLVSEVVFALVAEFLTPFCAIIDLKSNSHIVFVVVLF